MLTLKNITKDYITGDSVVHALAGVTLDFRKSEFVSILGASGCGKTTLLNIVGGLDRYTTGDLLINDKSTTTFKDGDWDTYRNTTIGFVFQSYNLIPHLTVLKNVEMALILSGVSRTERIARSKAALDRVGLSDQYNKRPNQLSGGQMQRVAIARALVNDPKIILADEPTGAIDSATSVQIMDLLKEISSDKLIIMVTHNGELAQKYSNRIIRLKDGTVIDDNNPYKAKVKKQDIESQFLENAEKAQNEYKANYGRKSSMSFWTALKLSFNNLLTKKVRTTLTAIAGSIGIIGVALVLSISNGMTQYINKMQSDTLAGFPVNITQRVFNMDGSFTQEEVEEYTSENIIYPYDSGSIVKQYTHINDINSEFVEHIEKMDSSLYNAISYQYGVQMNLIAKTGNLTKYKHINPSDIGWQELPSNDEFVKSQYDVIYGRYPASMSEIVLVVDSMNRLDETFLKTFGFNDMNKVYRYEDFVNNTFEIRLVYNDDFYTEDNTFTIGGVITPGYYKTNSFDLISKYISLKVVGVLRVNENTATDSLLSRGFAYMAPLTTDVLSKAKNSEVLTAQKGNNQRFVADIFITYLMPIKFNGIEFYMDVPYTGIAGVPFVDDAAKIEEAQTIHKATLSSFGGDKNPLGISIYPKSFESKEKIKKYIDIYNVGKTGQEDGKIVYSDLAAVVTNAVSTLIDTITIVLTAFASIALVVSSVMIGIITYVSVVERTKEIGVLRSLGARKKDISRVFNAETFIIGLAAGVIGIIVTLLLNIPINIIIAHLAGVTGIASLAVGSAAMLIGISVILTLIAGLIPSRIAAKRDPVVALRTD